MTVKALVVSLVQPQMVTGRVHEVLHKKGTFVCKLRLAASLDGRGTILCVSPFAFFSSHRSGQNYSWGGLCLLRG